MNSSASIFKGKQILTDQIILVDKVTQGFGNYISTVGYKESEVKKMVPSRKDLDEPADEAKKYNALLDYIDDTISLCKGAIKASCDIFKESQAYLKVAYDKSLK